MNAQKPDFYLGRLFDPKTGKTLDQALEYDPNDLTTHAIVTGMTGSGKTGLCISLLEEAALHGIPALMVDPKGDLTNLLMHFPNLAPDDFLPWIDADAARRQGKDVAAVAQETANTWKQGLAEWGILPERIQELKDSADFAVYTPGSDAGLQVSIMASLKAPVIPWEGNREVLREQISSTVIAILTLVGFNEIDPVQSREHILLSNIFESAWSQGKDLDLAELIMQTQKPPFPKLGVFPVESFFPEKERFDLALRLNNFLAAPAFQTWLEGEPLDIPALLFTPDGRPRHSVFYIAHLSDVERMFFVTLLFSSVETWMRTQSGSASLRALLYFDEIFGYLPPVQNPPSKIIILRMLKQARAFGVGLILATQNPVDADYKALSNAGTWMIGKLQTDQDKQRLLDGLSNATGNFDRAAYDNLISSLGKRIFLMHNVHEKGPVVFKTRFAMNFLAGPLTRAQIPQVNRLAGHTSGMQPAAAAAVAKAAQPTPTAQPSQPAAATEPPTQPRPKAAPQTLADGTTTRPAVPSAISEYFLPNDQSLSEAIQAERVTIPEGAPAPVYLYRPALLAQVRVRYFNRKFNLDYEQVHTVVVKNLDRRGIVRWDDFAFRPLEPREVQLNGLPQARFANLEAPLDDVKTMTALEKDFIDWAYRASEVKVRANETLKVYAGPQVTSGEFRELCSQAARDARDAELVKVGATFEKRLDALKAKITAEQRELSQDEQELSQRRMEEVGTVAETIIGFLGKRRRSVSSSLTKRRLTSQARADVDESKQVIADFQKQIERFANEQQQAEQQVNEAWAKKVDDVSEVTVTPLRKDIFMDLFGMAWSPYFVIKSGSQTIELPAFKS